MKTYTKILTYKFRYIIIKIYLSWIVTEYSGYTILCVNSVIAFKSQRGIAFWINKDGGYLQIMKVVKVINNNLIKSFDDNNNEILVMGCGLGYKKAPGHEVDEKLIERIYTCNDRKDSNQLTKLLKKIPLEHIQVTNQIVSFAKASLGKN